MTSEYTRRLEKIEVSLETWLPVKPDALWVKKAFNLEVEPKLAEPLFMPCRDLLKRGGKRWRPLLMLLVAESLGAKEETVLPLIPLVEFCHNASLIHDDIEDSSDERREKPAIHIMYGNDTAINRGSFLYFLPLVCLSSGNISDAVKIRVWEVWGEHLRRLHLGQSMDIAWHRDFRSLPELSEYELMCRLKTGCLARMAAEMGVYCTAPDNKELAQSFGNHAESLGLGFQILDDVKNLKSGIPGKKRGDDIIEGKKSLPVLLFLHRYPEKMDFAVRCFTQACFGGAFVPEVDEFIGVLDKAGVLEEAENQGRAFINASRDFFQKSGDLLGGFADLLG